MSVPLGSQCMLLFLIQDFRYLRHTKNGFSSAYLTQNFRASRKV